MPVVANIGSGRAGESTLPAIFNSWQVLRVDVDSSVNPDVVADATDLSMIASASIDALWSAHCIEHMYIHKAAVALREFHRVLSDDGFACIVVPDLQSIGSYLVSDQIHETIYESPAGPISAHDMLFGHGPALARGRTYMAHRCGFTPSLLTELFKATPFAELVLRRRPVFELVAIALKKASSSLEERDNFVNSLLA